MSNLNYKKWDKVFSKSNWGSYASEDLIRFIATYAKKKKTNKKNH